METFEITVGQSHRRLRLEPQLVPRQFKIYAADPAEDWIDHGQARVADLPIDGYLGTVKVESETIFDFDGSGAFTGQELQSIAAQVTKHPDFNN
jgi:hypothetical protein